MTKLLCGLAFLLAAACALASPTVTILGEYSNQESSNSEEPHITGYSVTLYQEGKTVFGRFCWATGIEVPCAPVQNAKLDRRGGLRFLVKMSIGTEVSRATGPEGRPARNLVEFTGRLNSRLLAGRLTKRNGYQPDLPPETEAVKLRRVPSQPAAVGSYSDWQADPNNSFANW